MSAQRLSVRHDAVAEGQIREVGVIEEVPMPFWKNQFATSLIGIVAFKAFRPQSNAWSATISHPSRDFAIIAFAAFGSVSRSDAISMMCVPVDQANASCSAPPRYGLVCCRVQTMPG